ncbi:glutaredoxin family protein [Lentibacillus cibarius]|uniref:Glutaredoxin family protein n=1 Tax=Lentibacillus cibarius TaxID=2583219 RepID=A0A549YHW9_9BACI|nr:glutaredoxin domain-containing protein [Lentibacillus cibarius]TRM11480.1 glutaredoxin family protein [Lentibacillus cibarius]
MNNITVYTTSTCPYCVMTKNFLAQNNISYKEVNVEKNPDMMQYIVSKTGQMGVPQTEINGSWVIGFDPDSIKEYLN